MVGSELIQKYLGDGPKLVRELFRVADEMAPSIVFIDEIDAVGTKRYDSTSGGEREIQRTMLELLNQLDGFDSRGDVKVIMATNRIETLDPALLRPGRIDRKIEFPLPDQKTKRRIFGIHTGRMSLAEDVNIEEFVMSKEELSGADIKAICTEAGLLALRERRMKARVRCASGGFGWVGDLEWSKWGLEGRGCAAGGSGNALRCRSPSSRLSCLLPGWRRLNMSGNRPAKIRPPVAHSPRSPPLPFHPHPLPPPISEHLIADHPDGLQEGQGEGPLQEEGPGARGAILVKGRGRCSLLAAPWLRKDRWRREMMGDLSFRLSLLLLLGVSAGVGVLHRRSGEGLPPPRRPLLAPASGGLG